MKIIITGATGSLGGYLTRYLAGKGHEIMAYGHTDNPPPGLLEVASYTSADISGPVEFPEADVCIHTAAVSDDKVSFKKLFGPNVHGSFRVAKASGNSRFIYISSSSVYLPEKEQITEEMAGRQDNRKLSAYGMSKLLAEEMIREASAHEFCFILRPRAFYGIGDRLILPRMLKMVKNGILQKPGGLKVRVSMTHYENICQAVERCMESDRQGINTYNVADETSYLLLDVLRKITRALYGEALPEKEISTGFLKVLALFRVGGITPLLVRSLTRDLVLDISKIKTELGYHTEIDLDNQIEGMAAWVKRIGGVEVLREAPRRLSWEVG